jgi:hypothetical protein
MSFSYDRYDRRQNSANRRGTFSYWVPLVFTVTVATAGLAAWVWSERRDDEESNDDDLSYGEEDYRKMPQPRDGQPPQDETIYSRVQGVMRRTPSPQQLFDSMSKKTAAGFAAAGAAAGAALASIREEGKDDFADHSRWSEEPSLRRNVEAQSEQSRAAVDANARGFAASVRDGPAYTGKKKTVAIVVSAESLMDDPHEEHGAYRSENAVCELHCPLTDFTELTCVDHLVASPRHRLQPHQALCPHLHALSTLSTKLPNWRCLPWIFLRCHFKPSPDSRRGWS